MNCWSFFLLKLTKPTAKIFLMLFDVQWTCCCCCKEILLSFKLFETCQQVEFVFVFCNRDIITLRTQFFRNGSQAKLNTTVWCHYSHVYLIMMRCYVNRKTFFQGFLKTRRFQKASDHVNDKFRELYEHTRDRRQDLCHKGSACFIFFPSYFRSLLLGCIHLLRQSLGGGGQRFLTTHTK